MTIINQFYDNLTHFIKNNSIFQSIKIKIKIRRRTALSYLAANLPMAGLISSWILISASCIPLVVRAMASSCVISPLENGTRKFSHSGDNESKKKDK